MTLEEAGRAFGLARERIGVTRSIERLRREAGECVLLCSNCHAEVEGGIRRLS